MGITNSVALMSKVLVEVSEIMIKLHPVFKEFFSTKISHALLVSGRDASFDLVKSEKLTRTY